MTDPQSKANPPAPQREQSPPHHRQESTASPGAPEPEGAGDSILLEGNIHASNSQIHNEINNEWNEYNNIELCLDVNARSLQLTPERFESIGLDRLQQIWQSFLFEHGAVERIVGALEKRRILVLAGKPESGKTGLAQLIAARLVNRRICSGALLCRDLNAKTRVDLRALTGEESRFQGRTLILRNALSRNTDLIRFVERLTESELQSWIDRLLDAGSFLILTASEMGSIRQRLSGLGILQEAPRPSSRMLLQGLQTCSRRRIEQLRGEEGNVTADEVEHFLQERGAEAAEKLESLPRIERFVRDYLIELAKGQLSFQQALERMDDTTEWLLADLPKDPETFYRVLALTLCSAAPIDMNAPWSGFEKLRRILSDFFRRELQQPHTERDLQSLYRRTEELEKSRAVLVQQGSAQPDGVAFLDPRSAEKLWQTLLGPGREIISTLLPLLQELAAGDDSFLRQSAAQALGRIGQIDPPRMIYPLIEYSPDMGASLGSLFQGILGSRDTAYRQACLARLRQALRSNPRRTLRSLLSVARIDLERALQEMKSFAMDRLTLQWRALHGESVRIREAEARIRATAPRGLVYKKIEALHRQAESQLAARIVPENIRPVMIAFSEVLTGLFFTSVDESLLLRTLRGWMQEHPESLGSLIPFLFLHPRGTASRLENISRRAAKISDSERSPLLLAAHVDSNAAMALQDFILEVYVRHQSFPGIFRHLQEMRFRSLLATWAQEAVAQRTTRTTMTRLLSGLFTSEDPRMGDWVLRQAQQPCPSEELTDLRRLAIEALTRPSSLKPAHR